MLQLKDISKTYVTGELTQTALDKVSLNFRDCEFVSILGKSGSGKTTLLNIIGGLDHYDEGDLIINDVSTKKYKDKDWDSYRNHSVGFVFQSYNLIPHQTILENVELALTISGVGPSERKERSLEALEKVGLKDQAHKKPNQLSGGQMQRVAIARALVNDPDILLADEPTGALDTKTSIQVMDLLKEVSKDRLVIMVTHNPDLAEKYSTRIVNLKDGSITGDSNPYELDKKTKSTYKNLGKASMSLLTAFSLSLNNLLTKKGRTILTAFAGSIGIIGIALILALSTGFQKYIDKVQEDALTSYPLLINEYSSDLTSILLSAFGKDETEAEEGYVLESQNIANIFASIGTNDLKSFKEYMEKNQEEVDKYVKRVDYGYNITPNIYTKDYKNELLKANPSDSLTTLMGAGGMSSTNVSMYDASSVFFELNSDDSELEDSMNIIKGRLPKKYDEVVIVIPNEGHISDLLLYTLGFKDQKELNDRLTKVYNGESISKDEIGEPIKVSYDRLMDIELKLILATDTYKYNSQYNLYEDMTSDKSFMNDLFNKSLRLNIVGIVSPKDANETTSLMSGVGFRSDLIKYIINESAKTEIVKKQLANADINVISGKSFDENNDSTGIDFNDLVTIDTKKLNQAFQVNINEKDIKNLTEGYINEISAMITANTGEAEALFRGTLGEIFEGLLNDYIESNNTMGISQIKIADIESIIDNYFKKDVVKEKLGYLEKNYTIPSTVFENIYKEFIKGVLQVYVLNASVDGGVSAYITSAVVNEVVDTSVNSDLLNESAHEIGIKMVEANMQKNILTKVGELSASLMSKMANAFKVDESKFKEAFKFNMNEDQIKRLFSAMSTKNVTQSTQKSNLLNLGYQDLNVPSSMSFYFKDFEGKEKFIDFIENYNKENEDNEEKVLTYSDITGILISSVRVIVDSVSYVLIAFVSISLIVSSIMIGIITYISVLERTKEIGILRAIGASKRNISNIFNAETFIIGFLSGLIGVVVSWLLIIPINIVIHNLTDNLNINAVLPIKAAIILIILSTVLTLIGGIIPSKSAAKKDPVLALRTE